MTGRRDSSKSHWKRVDVGCHPNKFCLKQEKRLDVRTPKPWQQLNGMELEAVFKFRVMQSCPHHRGRFRSQSGTRGKARRSEDGGSDHGSPFLESLLSIAILPPPETRRFVECGDCAARMCQGPTEARCLTGAVLAPGAESTSDLMQAKRPQIVARELTPEAASCFGSTSLVAQFGGCTFEQVKVLLDDRDTFDLFGALGNNPSTTKPQNLET